MATTITAKGQVTVPKRVREYLGIEPGMAVDFVVTDDGQVVLRPADGTRPASRFERARAMAGPGPSTEEIMRLLRPDD